MVSKFKFVRYGHIKKKIALYMPRFYSDVCPKSEVSISNSKILRLTDFQGLDPNFVLALEAKFLKIEGFRPSIYVLNGWYDETPAKNSPNTHYRVEGIFARPHAE